MSPLLLRLLRRNQFCMPARDGGDGGGSGGGAVDELDDPDTDGQDDADGDAGDLGDEGSGDADDSDEDADEEGGDPDEVDDDGITISLDGADDQAEAEEQRAPSWVRDLRKSNREKDRAIRERDAEIARLRGQQAGAGQVEVGKEPDPDDYEMFEADGKAKFKADWAAWSQRKADAEKSQRDANEAQETAQRAFNERRQAVEKAGAALKLSPEAEPFAEASERLGDTLKPHQVGMLIDAAKDPASAAKLIYAISKSPKHLAELAALDGNPVKYIAAVVRLEAGVKESKGNKKAPPPDTPVRSSGGGSAKASAVENTLERAREEARKTGDYSKVMQIKREQAARAERAKKRA
jgi:hypothetical protein